MQTYTSIRLECHNHLANITLCRPEKHNAFDDVWIGQFRTIIQNIAEDPTIDIVKIQGEGKNFCAGADLNWMKRMANFTLEENKKDAWQLALLLRELSALEKPVIALVQGHAIGGALGIIACCDAVIAQNDARFRFSEVKLGLIPATIAPYLIRRIGFSHSQRYFITAETFTAEEAKAMGLIHQVVAPEILNFAGDDLIAQLFENSPYAMGTIKKLIHRINPIDDELIHETADLLAEIRISPQGQEGLNAFFEKRKAKWR